ncbi:DUF3592 domain-containing protein [Streptomyces sp. NPDC023723]|uniref:DUF3592 domain-containing protein n=1 Tax=Streptomyces sp. NPDC023723 TaxID=3154323 RepID=UPI0033E3B594
MIFAGAVLICLGLLSIFAQSGSFLEHRRLQALKHHGVDGQAVYAFHEYVTNSHRVFLDICLPEGQPRARFHEYMQALPGPEGTVVPVVYDSRKPKRAKVGVRAELDYEFELVSVLLLGAGGLVLIGIGTVLCLIGALV